ncbi:MAG: hypothetical protein IIA98_00145 [Proteobacteria bacterium]|nr:hypothetical protein [Pseudomonadota bacterium]
MSWRRTIKKDWLKKFDKDGLNKVKAKLQTGSYGIGKKARHARNYVAGIEGDLEAEKSSRKESRTKEAIILKRVGFVVAVGLVIVAVVETCSGQ